MSVGDAMRDLDYLRKAQLQKEFQHCCKLEMIFELYGRGFKPSSVLEKRLLRPDDHVREINTSMLMRSKKYFEAVLDAAAIFKKGHAIVWPFSFNLRTYC